MQSMFDTGETENQLIFVEKLHFRAINSGYCIENRAMRDFVGAHRVAYQIIDRV